MHFVCWILTIFSIISSDEQLREESRFVEEFLLEERNFWISFSWKLKEVCELIRKVIKDRYSIVKQ